MQLIAHKLLCTCSSCRLSRECRGRGAWQRCVFKISNYLNRDKPHIVRFGWNLARLCIVLWAEK